MANDQVDSVGEWEAWELMMTPELTKALGKYRDASDESLMAHAAECLEEALQHFAENVRRETIVRCAGVARARGNGDTADDLTALLME